jgi:hypothetical protein
MSYSATERMVGEGVIMICMALLFGLQRIVLRFLTTQSGGIDEPIIMT